MTENIYPNLNQSLREIISVSIVTKKCIMWKIVHTIKVNKKRKLLIMLIQQL